MTTNDFRAKAILAAIPALLLLARGLSVQEAAEQAKALADALTRAEKDHGHGFDTPDI